MSRRERLTISLFPFMSILACTIGALTFLLVTLAMTSMGATRLVGEEEEKRAEFLAKELPALEARLAALDREWETLSEAEARIAELDAALEARGLRSGASLSGTLKELDDAKRTSSLERKTRRLAARRAKIERDREEVEVSIEVLESRRETLPILIDPTDLSRSQTPFFVECEEDGITAYRASDDFAYFVPLPAVSTSGDFGRYLRRVRAMPGALLVLLVREDGIATARQTEAVARGAGIRTAKLPLPGAGKLDFRLMRRAEGSS
jgi:multidrug efflux pump subunit AcrA (membrane-fusion protein)